MSASLWPLPEHLQVAVEQGALSVREASEMEDCSLSSQQEWVTLPSHLNQAAIRLWLLEMESPAPMQ